MTPNEKKLAMQRDATERQKCLDMVMHRLLNIGEQQEQAIHENDLDDLIRLDEEEHALVVLAECMLGDLNPEIQVLLDAHPKLAEYVANLWEQCDIAWHMGG